MRKKYKIHKKRKRINNLVIIIILLVLLCTMATAYSLWSTDLEIEGAVSTKQIQPGSVNAGGMEVSLDQDGIITLNGTVSATEAYFIKVSNGVEAVNQGKNASVFPRWLSEAPENIADVGSQVRHSIEYISGTWSKNKNLNVVLRNENNTAVLNCKLSSDMFIVDEIAANNLLVEYLYVEPGLQCQNLKIRTRIQKLEPVLIDSDLHLFEGTITYKGITCSINSDGEVSLNGTATDKMFIKLSGGIATTGTMDGVWSNTGATIATVGEGFTFGTEIIGGTASGQEVNLCLRSNDNIAYSILKLIEGQTSVDLVLDKEVNVVYLYIKKNVTVNNYILKPYIQRETQVYT